MRLQIPQGARFSGIEILWQPVVERMCKSKWSAGVTRTCCCFSSNSAGWNNMNDFDLIGASYYLIAAVVAIGVWVFLLKMAISWFWNRSDFVWGSSSFLLVLPFLFLLAHWTGENVPEILFMFLLAGMSVCIGVGSFFAKLTSVFHHVLKV